MRHLFFTLTFLTFTARCLPQTQTSDGTAALLAKFDDYRSGTIQEQLFVHTDKSFYLAGEVCWFKLYYVDGAFHQPLHVSKVAYVEILDKDNKFVLQGKIGLEKAEGSGSFYLPLTLSSGHYKLRAYTNWMKNFGPDYFFEEELTIVNTLKSLPLTSNRSGADPLNPSGPGAPPAGAAANSYHISFFPEGGNLVKGIPTRIAFQVTDANGRGVSCEGVVINAGKDSLNANKDTLASFRPLRSGIGSFFFTPPENGVRKAVLRMPDGQLLTEDLPKVYEAGMVMNVNESTPDQIRVTVRSRGWSSADIYLFVQSGQSVRQARKGSLMADSAVFILDKASLGEGISQITLFDGNLRPVCERLYFKRPARQLGIDAQTDQREYGIRKKVRMEIGTSDDGGKGDSGGKGNPLPASLSLSVYRLDSLQSPQGMDIYNYLWLSSDLKGNVESPETYFSSRGEESDRALDNLMMTHGWRRFRWENILNGRPHTPNGDTRAFPYPPEFVGQLITGKLSDMQTGMPLQNRIGYLSVPGTQFSFNSAETDSSGKLTFDVKNFYGPGGFVIHSGEESDSPCKVQILSPFSEQYSDRPLSAFALTFSTPPQALLEGLTDRSVGMQVQNVYVGDSLQKFRAPLLDSLRFYGQPDHAYLLDDYTRFTTMEEVLREYVREINVNHMYGRLHVKMLNEPVREFFEDNAALVLLDGVPVPADKIFAYDPLKVKKLEVMACQYFLGPSAFNGVASFTTYNGDYDGFELDPHSLLIDYEGLQLQREFYSPVYATDQQAASRQPDFRNLLYWSPDIHTDGHGKKELDFYTSDIPGKYVAVVQGIAGNGLAGVKYIYFVSK